MRIVSFFRKNGEWTDEIVGLLFLIFIIFGTAGTLIIINYIGIQITGGVVIVVVMAFILIVMLVMNHYCRSGIDPQTGWYREH